MFEAFEDTNKYYIVTRLLSGGELEDELQKRIKNKGAFNQREAAVLMHQILRTINYCHNEKNVVHQ